uniref:Uncharacterized protein n=1 Tax=Opuntia streptacantha TaxID=393608 RepID=A0A7C8ZJY0_OPUST
MPFLEPKPPDPSHPASYFLSWHLPCSSLLKFCFASIVSPESSMDARSGSSKYGSDVVPEPWCSLACLWVSQLDSATGSANLDVKFVNLGLFFVLKYSFLDGHESAPSCTGSSLSRFIHVPGDVRLQCQTQGAQLCVPYVFCSPLLLGGLVPCLSCASTDLLVWCD